MPLPETLLPLFHALGWTVAHSLWQIALVYGVFKLTGLLFYRHNRLYYIWAIVAMLAAAGCSVWTFAREYERLAPVYDASTEEALAVTSDFLAAAPTATVLPGQERWTAELTGWLEAHATGLGWAWCAGVLLLSLRLLGGYWLVCRLRSQANPPLDREIGSSCAAWARQLGIGRAVRLLESAHVQEPLTLGFWKPVVLFPAGLLLQLSPAQVEGLLLHELAHIRRHDYLVNLFQLMLDVCFFYHPLFWLISREIRTRREYCCDDLVLEHTSNRLLYASTLTELKLATQQPKYAFAMNATGKSAFADRIMRIAGVTPKRSHRANLFVLLLLLGFSLPGLLWPTQGQAAIEPALEKTAPSEPQLSTAETLHDYPDTLPPRRPVRTAAPARAADPVKTPAAVPDAAVSVRPAEAPEAVAMEIERLNVFYIGVENPLKIAASGVPPGEVQVRLNVPAQVVKNGSSFLIRVFQPGEATVEILRLSDGTETLLSTKAVRIKRIPDPTVRVNGLRSGVLSMQEALGLTEVQPVLENLDLEERCEVVGYELTLLPPRQDPSSRNNKGAKIEAPSLARIETLTPGSSLFFDDIRVSCPGDATPRNVGGLAFKIRQVKE